MRTKPSHVCYSFYRVTTRADLYPDQLDFKFTGHIIVPRQPTQLIAFYKSILIDNDAQRVCLVPHQVFKRHRRKRSPDEIKTAPKSRLVPFPSVNASFLLCTSGGGGAGKHFFQKFHPSLQMHRFH